MQKHLRRAVAAFASALACLALLPAQAGSEEPRPAAPAASAPRMSPYAMAAARHRAETSASGVPVSLLTLRHSHRPARQTVQR